MQVKLKKHCKSVPICLQLTKFIQASKVASIEIQATPSFLCCSRLGFWRKYQQEHCYVVNDSLFLLSLGRTKIVLRAPCHANDIASVALPPSLQAINLCEKPWFPHILMVDNRMWLTIGFELLWRRAWVCACALFACPVLCEDKVYVWVCVCVFVYPCAHVFCLPSGQWAVFTWWLLFAEVAPTEEERRWYAWNPYHIDIFLKKHKFSKHMRVCEVGICTERTDVVRHSVVEVD